MHGKNTSPETTRFLLRSVMLLATGLAFVAPVDGSPYLLSNRFRHLRKMRDERDPARGAPRAGAYRATAAVALPRAAAAPELAPARPAEPIPTTAPMAPPLQMAQVRPPVRPGRSHLHRAARSAQALARQTPPPATGSSVAATPVVEKQPVDEAVNWDEEIHIDLKEVDLRTLVRFLGERTKTNFLMDQSVAGKVDVVGPESMSLREAFYLLHSLLEQRGFTVVQVGKVKKIVPVAKAKGEPIETLLRYTPSDEPEPARNKTVTQMLRLRHVSVEDVRPLVSSLLSGPQALVAHKDANLLVLTENALNIEKIVRIIREIDTPVKGKTVFTHRLRYAFAQTVAENLNKVLEKKTSVKETPQTREIEVARPVILTDTRTNSLVIICLELDLPRIRSLIERFDVDPDFAPKIRFLTLGHSDAETIRKQVESALALGKPDPSLDFKIVADPRSQSLIVTAYSNKLLDRITELIERLDKDSGDWERSNIHIYHLEFAEAEKVAEILSKVSDVLEPKSEGGTGAKASDKLSIIADKTSNSLVINAPPEQYRHLVKVIQQLDHVRPQVLVEVLIAEIDLNHSHNLGLDFNFLDTDSGRDENRPFAIGNADNIEGLAGGGFPNGLNVGILTGRSFDLGAAAGGDAGELSKVALLIQAFQGDSRVNILSAPQIVTADNEEAKISVGERIQIPSGLTTAANTGLNTITSFTSEDLGVILTLTPRITKNEHVVLKVNQTIKSRSNETLYSQNIPVINSREVETNITVPDRTTVVIGGLISETVTETESRMPFVGNLPLIGKLFRDRDKAVSKRNLLIFLTPRILRTADDARTLTRDRKALITSDLKQGRVDRNSLMHHAFSGDEEGVTVDAAMERRRRIKGLVDRIRQDRSRDGAEGSSSPRPAG